LMFFFQAEDGIRDRNVTGVQTCALPIWPGGGARPTAFADESVRSRCALARACPASVGASATSRVKGSRPRARACVRRASVVPRGERPRTGQGWASALRPWANQPCARADLPGVTREPASNADFVHQWCAVAQLVQVLFDQRL